MWKCLIQIVVQLRCLPFKGLDSWTWGFPAAFDEHTFLGEEADAISGLTETQNNSMDTALQAREQVNNLMERCCFRIPTVK